jgi:hypothetical protein
VTLPLSPPLAVGAKLTVNVTLWPEVRVSGMLRPVKLNPVPEAEALEMVTLEFPVFFTVPYNDFLLPT